MVSNLFTKVYHDAQDFIDDPTAFAVYVAIKRYADFNTGENCFPGAKRISQTAHVSRALVFKKLRLLELNGWIKRIGRIKENKVEQDSNLYVVTETGGNRMWIKEPPLVQNLDYPPSRKETAVVQRVDGGSPESRHYLDTSTDNHLPISNDLETASEYEDGIKSKTTNENPDNMDWLADCN